MGRPEEHFRSCFQRPLRPITPFTSPIASLRRVGRIERTGQARPIYFDAALACLASYCPQPELYPSPVVGRRRSPVVRAARMNGFVSSCPAGRIECGGRPGLLASDPGQCLWRERPRFEQRRPKKMNQPFLDNESAVFGCTANFKRPIDSTAATVEEDRRRQ